MFGPGESVGCPDPTEGIVAIKDLPQGLSLWRTAVTMSTPPAHDVTIWPLVTNAGNAPCTTWAMCPPDVQLIFG